MILIKSPIHLLRQNKLNSAVTWSEIIVIHHRMVKFDQDDSVFDTQQYPSIAYTFYLKFRFKLLSPFEIIYPEVKNIIAAKYWPIAYFMLLLDRGVQCIMTITYNTTYIFSSHWKGREACNIIATTFSPPPPPRCHWY